MKPVGWAKSCRQPFSWISFHLILVCFKIWRVFFWSVTWMLFGQKAKWWMRLYHQMFHSTSSTSTFMTSILHISLSSLLSSHHHQFFPFLCFSFFLFSFFQLFIFIRLLAIFCQILRCFCIAYPFPFLYVYLSFVDMLQWLDLCDGIPNTYYQCSLPSHLTQFAPCF